MHSHKSLFMNMTYLLTIGFHEDNFFVIRNCLHVIRKLKEKVTWFIITQILMVFNKIPEFTLFLNMTHLETT